jgi:hypothetical protein
MYQNKYIIPKTIQPMMPNIEYLFRGEELEENETNNMNAVPPMQQNIVQLTEQNTNPSVQQNTVPPVQQIPNVKPLEHQMPNASTNPSKMDKNKIKADAEKIVKIFEQSNPDILKALINCSVSVFAAKKYLCKVVETALMHHHKMNNTKK